MKANVDHNHVLHEHVIIVSMDTVPVPRVSALASSSTISATAMTGIFFVAASYGYMERPDVPAALRFLDPIDTEAGSIWRTPPISLEGGSGGRAQRTMRRGVKQLFIAVSHMTGDAAGSLRASTGSHGHHRRVEV